jgi:hypothetical protein
MLNVVMLSVMAPNEAIPTVPPFKYLARLKNIVTDKLSNLFCR